MILIKMRRSYQECMSFSVRSSNDDPTLWIVSRLCWKVSRGTKMEDSGNNAGASLTFSRLHEGTRRVLGEPRVALSLKTCRGTIHIQADPRVSTNFPRIVALWPLPLAISVLRLPINNQRAQPKDSNASSCTDIIHIRWILFSSNDILLKSTSK